MKLTIICIFILLLFCTGLANAGTIECNGKTWDTDGTADQIEINEALEYAKENQGSTVYLEADVYYINGPIYIYSDTILTGDPDAIIRVSKYSSQFFINGIGLINHKDYPLKNVEIYGFQIDGNLDELPKSYANSGKGDHNCERAIYLRGNKKAFMENILVHDMQIYDCFSDGIQLAYGIDVHCYNNLLSNCQHSSIFYVNDLDSTIHDNKIAGITSDCVRLDNCVNNKIYNNILYSYTGPNTNGQGTNGENALQIGDEGYSHGGGSPKLNHTENIEVYGNTFANTGLRGIWLDAAGLEPSTNVYIHDNTFLDGSEFETDGVSVSDVSYEHPPTKEQSEKIFASIFDVLNLEFTDSAYVEQGVLNPNKEWESKGKYTQAWIDVPGYEGMMEMRGIYYIPDSPDKCAIIMYDTKNTAKNPDGQKVSENHYMSDGKLKVELQITTKYKIKKYKTVDVLGKSIKIPYYETKKEKVKYTKTFTNFPETFPVMSVNDLNVTVDYQNNSINPHAIISVKEKNSSEGVITKVVYSYDGSQATEYRLIGYVNLTQNGFKIPDFKPTGKWMFTDDRMSYGYQSLYIEGKFDINNLKVIVSTPYDEFEVERFNYTEAGDPFKKKINPAPFVIGLVLFVMIRPFLHEFKRFR